MALVLQSFGKENEYRRAILTIVSYYAWSKPEEAQHTILFTDNPTYFKKWLEGFTIHYVLLTPDKIKFMRGDIDFLHRMKIALIEEAFDFTKENMLYADSDTFFISDPQPLMQTLSATMAYMHIQEYKFETLLKMTNEYRAFGEMLLHRKFKKSTGSELIVSIDQFSWNAGVMMLHTSHVKVLPDVYALTDQFYTIVNHHASEQFAFSVVLQNAVKLQPCNAAIYHYWYRVKKQIIDNFLEKELIESWRVSPREQKEDHIKRMTVRLPSFLENHVLTLRDDAIQLFHDGRYREGCGFAFRALMKNPFNLQFDNDLLYHAKKFLSNK
jgi:hypothetical protein